MNEFMVAVDCYHLLPSGQGAIYNIPRLTGGAVPRFLRKAFPSRSGLDISPQEMAFGPPKKGSSPIFTQIFTLRALALWHTVHIPIGVALFITAFVHIIAAIYYATLLR